MRRLLSAGNSVRVWNRSAEPLRGAVADGAEAATDLDEIFMNPIVLSCLSNDESFRKTLMDRHLLRGAKCAVHVNLATVSIDLAREATNSYSQHGIGYVAAPMLGRAAIAESGRLNVLVGGRSEHLRQVRPLIDAFAVRVWELGSEPARANVVKIAVNSMLATAIASLAEGLALVEAHHVDAADFVDLISNTSFPGPVYETYGGLMAERRYQPAGFTSHLGLKDVELALSAAHHESTSALPVVAAVRHALLDAIDAGWGENDWATLAELGRRRLTAD